MIDHFTLPVSDLARAKAFYAPVLAALGIPLMADFPPDEDGAACGFGRAADNPAAPGEHAARFWIVCSPKVPRVATPGGQHIAFRAPSRAAVDAFHAAALANGGRDNGAPGLRPHYHARYYAAFALDPDGHRLEAVCHE